MIKSKFIFLVLRFGFNFLFLTIAFRLSAQVVNNSIRDRLELKLNGQSTPSSTANSTVEWSCINKVLTKKCLVYHNDLWFHFTPPVSGKYFLNLSSQQCKNLFGVQMIVIEGNPCEIKTYKILQCIPKIFQDDAFVQLDSLKANTLYLVNIDGFLGDFCEFNIQFSTRPAGLPQQNTSLDTLNLEAQSNGKLILLKWRANQLLMDDISHFEVHRLKKGEAKSNLTSIISAKGNALGNFVEDYSMYDTLSTSGIYQYKIIGVERNSEGRVFLDQVNIHFKPTPSKELLVKIPFKFDSKGRVEVFVINKSDNELLDYSVYEYVTPESRSINLTKFFDYGIRNFWIKIRHTKSKELKQFIYSINEDSEPVLLDK